MAQCPQCNSPVDVVGGVLSYHTNTYDLRVCPASGGEPVDAVAEEKPAPKKRAPRKKAS